MSQALNSVFILLFATACRHRKCWQTISRVISLSYWAFVRLNGLSATSSGQLLRYKHGWRKDVLTTVGVPSLLVEHGRTKNRIEGWCSRRKPAQ